MRKTRKYFTQDHLVSKVRSAITTQLTKSVKKQSKITQMLNATMCGLAMFVFKYVSLLKFDQLRNTDKTRCLNIKKLFGIDYIPCDTHMRTILDNVTPETMRSSFTSLFSILQRSNILKNYLFLDEYYLISVDGTGYFSSSKIHCSQCLVKEHRNGNKTYHHQMLSAAMVYPSCNIVFPFAPEPIIKQDGSKKNDCELNAFKRWIKNFRREHPHLKVIILADGLSSNAPFIKLLRSYNCNFILVCKDNDHKYLSNWVNAADEQDAPVIEEINDIHKTYKYMNDVPLNESNYECKVNVLRYKEKCPKKSNPTTWMWVTDLKITKANVKKIPKAGRSRWRVENEVFNTLKNQGYAFEHNFGHGNKNLTTVFSFLMMLAFFIDQCLQLLNKRFQKAYAKCRAKYSLWEEMRSAINVFILPSFEVMYEAIAQPPPPLDLTTPNS